MRLCLLYLYILVGLGLVAAVVDFHKQHVDDIATKAGAAVVDTVRPLMKSASIKAKIVAQQAVRAPSVILASGLYSNGSSRSMKVRPDSAETVITESGDFLPEMEQRSGSGVR
jgi:hypothetical protein